MIQVLFELNFSVFIGFRSGLNCQVTFIVSCLGVICSSIIYSFLCSSTYSIILFIQSLSYRCSYFRFLGVKSHYNYILRCHSLNIFLLVCLPKIIDSYSCFPNTICEVNLVLLFIQSLISLQLFSFFGCKISL